MLLGLVGCGGASHGERELARADSLAARFSLLPDRPELRRHVLVADLERLRAVYPNPDDLQASLVGVWLPDALVAANRELWRRSYGLRLSDISAFVAAGFHPAELTVVEGEFAPSAMRAALRRSGYRARGRVLARGLDGSIDITSEEGRLALSSLNRVVISPTRVIAASTTALTRSARSPSGTLATSEAFAAVATALDPITSAIVLDAELVRPPVGVPFETLPQHSADLVAVGIDDGGPESRTLRIALMYGDPEQARADAELIERDLGSTALPGDPGTRFSDLASDWQVKADGRAILVTGTLAPGSGPGTWRLLVERGDLAPLVLPQG